MVSDIHSRLLCRLSRTPRLADPKLECDEMVQSSEVSLEHRSGAKSEWITRFNGRNDSQFCVYRDIVGWE